MTRNIRQVATFIRPGKVFRRRAPRRFQFISNGRRKNMLSRPRSGFAVAIIAALFFLNQPSSQFAQQPAPQQKQETKQPDSQTPDQEPSVRISTQLVQIDATVTDKKGEHVDDLTEDDFELTV